MTVMTPRHVVRVGATAGAALVALGSMGGTAYAYWTATGTGTATAAAGTVQPLTTTAATVPTGLLYPGAKGDVRITVNNPNPFPVTVTSVTGSGAITSDKGAACDASTGVTFTDQVGLGLVVPAAGSQSFTLAGAVSMSNSSDSTCQGATFTLPVVLAAASR